MRLRLGLFIPILALVLSGASEIDAATKRPVVRIGIVTDGPSQRLSEIGETIKNEILELTKGEFDVKYPDKMQLDGSWSVSGVKGALDNLLANPKVNVIITLGVIGSHEAATRKKLSKPVIAPFVIDAQLQGLPVKDGTSGVKNMNYLASFKSLARDVKTFREIMPFNKMVLLGDEAILKSFPMVKRKLARIARASRIGIKIMPVTETAKTVLKAIPPQTEAVFITPLLRLSPKEFDRLIAGLNARHLPTFSLAGEHEVKRGVMASMSPEEDLIRMARRIALNVQRVLLGEDPGTLSVNFPVGERLTINMATVRAINKWPSFRVLTEAELLNEKEEKLGRQLSLYTTVREAVSVNLDLAAADRKVAAGLGRVYQARAGLLPQMTVTTTANQFRESAGEGALPLAERSANWRGTATQLLYSDDVWTSYTVEKRRQKSREEERRQLQLDVAAQGATSYLNVLKSKTTEGIQKENLRLTRINLELARVRVAVGQARRDEVFRWEAEIARSRINVLDAQAVRRQAKIGVNRILYRPLEEEFRTREAGIDDPLLLISQKDLFTYVDNPRNFAIFLNFQAQEGIKASPELRRLDALVAAQERKVLNARRAYWLPEASFSADAFQRYAQGGKIGGGGVGGVGTLPGLPSSGGEESGPFWAVSVGLSFPLFEGGGKDATQVRESESLRRVELEREATLGRVEERIRATLYQAGASFPGIRLSREAAEAGRKNYELVVDQYRRGQVNIVTLTDAQTFALDRDLEAANAVYDFLIDLAQIQRAVGRFDYFMYADQRAAWFQRLRAFFAKAGVRTPS